MAIKHKGKTQSLFIKIKWILFIDFNGKEVLKLNEELITGQKKIFSNTDG